MPPGPDPTTPVRTPQGGPGPTAARPLTLHNAPKRATFSGAGSSFNCLIVSPSDPFRPDRPGSSRGYPRRRTASEFRLIAVAQISLSCRVWFHPHRRPARLRGRHERPPLCPPARPGGRRRRPGRSRRRAVVRQQRRLRRPRSTCHHRRRHHHRHRHDQHRRRQSTALVADAVDQGTLNVSSGGTLTLDTTAASTVTAGNLTDATLGGSAADATTVQSTPTVLNLTGPLDLGQQPDPPHRAGREPVRHGHRDWPTTSPATPTRPSTSPPAGRSPTPAPAGLFVQRAR